MKMQVSGGRKCCVEAFRLSVLPNCDCRDSSGLPEFESLWGIRWTRSPDRLAYVADFVLFTAGSDQSAIGDADEVTMSKHRRHV